ncbi:hypothetical protein FSP39_019296 [Pinctada imbricata]|uniref:Uncharacterized protein n=1 Tax=Pinctada imbricata TaxID=66713 RepID=A0AA89C3M1_PINIB|nr:hypothetical protein FSP39_019296 [Pinctada imbricata]
MVEDSVHEESEDVCLDIGLKEDQEQQIVNIRNEDNPAEQHVDGNSEPGLTIESSELVCTEGDTVSTTALSMQDESEQDTEIDNQSHFEDKCMNQSNCSNPEEMETDNVTIVSDMEQCSDENVDELPQDCFDEVGSETKRSNSDGTNSRRGSSEGERNIFDVLQTELLSSEDKDSFMEEKSVEEVAQCTTEDGGVEGEAQCNTEGRSVEEVSTSEDEESSKGSESGLKKYPLRQSTVVKKVLSEIDQRERKANSGGGRGRPPKDLRGRLSPKVLLSRLSPRKCISGTVKLSPVKKGPGRPRKSLVDEEEKTESSRMRKISFDKEERTGPGRPRKISLGDEKKQDPGRPRKISINNEEKSGRITRKGMRTLVQGKRRLIQMAQSWMKIHRSVEDVQEKKTVKLREVMMKS